MGIRETGKIVLKSCGDPRKASANIPEGETRARLGIIFGIATGVFKQVDSRDDKEYIGLRGMFSAINLSTGDETRSGKLFLPESFQAPIEGILTDDVTADGEVVKAGAKSVRFSYYVDVVKATNPLGYSWELDSTMPPSSDDPLTQMRMSLMPAKTDAIAEKQPEPVNEPAPPKGHKGKAA